MHVMEFKEKIVAFVDILGWKDLVRQAESGTGRSLPELVGLLDCFGPVDQRARFEDAGPKCCPAATFHERNLDFRVTQVSDCAIISAEISPAGVINLINYCWTAVFHFLEHGIMCRGYIKLGSVYHEDQHIIGSAYQDAYTAERNVTAFKREADERGTPFVEVDPTVMTYAEDCNDACVKTMYSRMTRSDGVVTALFPIQRIKHHVVPERTDGVGSYLRQLESNNNVRKRILRYKASIEVLVNPDNPDAIRKARHYLDALDSQLNLCDETDVAINAFVRQG